ncbi:DUF6210 family protein [Streptomyces sp. NPDC057137]|uniref:DUF6210 family protein n=1 Tax=Streptomyces sp. NPDC057137 TaxID=3346030 RepID=UPI003641B5D5
MPSSSSASARFVFIDPDGTGGDWAHVVVEAPTGVFYQQEYGGTSRRQGQAEGYLVPVAGASAGIDALAELFAVFRGGGAGGHAWAETELDALRAAVGAVRFWACDGAAETPHPLRLDESRLPEADDAWLPVRTPDGPGLLVWSPRRVKPA